MGDQIRHPDVIVKVWIDSRGIEAGVNQSGTGYGVCSSFDRTYDKPGQVAAIWDSFRREVLEFIEEFRKNR